MNIQIMGTKKCQDTRKAERWFKERRVLFQYRDLAEDGIAKGELTNITSSLTADELIDREGKEFRKLNLHYMVFDPFEKILEAPLILKTPIVRNGRKATAGYQPEVWKQWLAE